MTASEPFAAEDVSPVLVRAAAHRTSVSNPDKPYAFYAGIVGIAVAGIFIFSSLAKDRSARATPIAVAPRLTQVATVEPQSEPVSTDAAMTTPQPPFSGTPVDSAGGDTSARLKSPAMIVETGVSGEAPALAHGSTEDESDGDSKPAPAPDRKLGPNELFSEKISGSAAQTVSATRLSNMSLIAPQGTVVPAILETAIKSDLPGFARAVVSRDVRGFDGGTVVIPRGSKLIGQYKSGVAAGQSRAFVVWSRLLTPDGISVDIGSPGADRLGRGGLEGETNTHFFQRFGSSILLSVISAGLDAAANQNSNATNTAIVIGSPQQATNVASIALQKQIDIPDTISVPQGAPIRVFIARDLDFSNVMKKAQ